MLDLRSFAAAVNDIAESRVTSTLGACNSMRVWGARMLDTGTYSRNTLCPAYSGELDGDGSDRHDWAYFEIDSDEDDLDSHPPDRALRPTKVVFSRSQASSTLKAIWTSRSVSTPSNRPNSRESRLRNI